jgi:phosphoribosyl 1,2-cyclic phosphodiesterase
VKVKFWGTRGSIPTPGSSTSKYGGNTSCIEVRSGSSIFIFDAGSGIRNLGLSLIEEFDDRPIRGHIFFSHFHWDHIQGLPFFQPSYQAKNHFTIYSAFIEKEKLMNIFEGQMGQLHFPVPFSQMESRLDLICIPVDGISIGNIRVLPLRLNHPGQAVGYKLMRGDKSLVIATDNELNRRGSGEEGESDRAFRAFISEVDLLIADGQYSDSEYDERKGWGHSFVGDLCSNAAECGVKKLALFHHDPDHDDYYIDELLPALEKEPKYDDMLIFAAREGMAVKI